MRAIIGLGIFFFVAGVILGLAQLWFAPWSAETFLKIEVTLAALLLIAVVVFYVIREHKDDVNTRSGDRL